MRYFVLALFAAPALSACGGVGGGEFGPVTQARGAGGHTTEVVDDNTRFVRSGVRVSSGRTSVRNSTITRRTDRPVEGFQTFGGEPDGIMMFEAIGENGGVRITGHVDHRSGDTAFRTEAEGLSSGGTMPEQGTAQYAGKYVGFIERGQGTTFPGLTQSYVTGDVSLTADFGRNQVSGGIVNRDRYLTRTGQYLDRMDDVELSAHSIANGESVGTGSVSGGGFPIYQPQNGEFGGSWSVAFGGNGATEAGGLVEIDHDVVNGASAPDDYVEVGGFVATKQ